MAEAHPNWGSFRSSMSEEEAEKRRVHLRFKQPFPPLDHSGEQFDLPPFSSHTNAASALTRINARIART